MTDNELIEQVARAADEYLGAKCGMKLRKHALDGLAKAAIAAMQPHIEAQREDAARRALEAAADTAAKYVVGKPLYRNGDHSKPKSPSLARVGTAKAIRTIDPAQFRRPADG